MKYRVERSGAVIILRPYDSLDRFHNVSGFTTFSVAKRVAIDAINYLAFAGKTAQAQAKIHLRNWTKSDLDHAVKNGFEGLKWEVC